MHILATIIMLTAVSASAQEVDIQELTKEDAILTSAFERLREFDSQGNHRAAIQELMSISWTFALNSQIKESMEAIQMARTRCIKNNDSTMMPTLLMLGADNYKALGAYQTALAYYHEADSLFESRNDFANHIFALYCKAYCHINRYEENRDKRDVDSAVNLITGTYQYLDSAYSYHKATISLIVSRILLSQSETMKGDEAKKLAAEALEVIDDGKRIMRELHEEDSYKTFMELNTMSAYITLDSLAKASKIMETFHEDRLPQNELRLYYLIATKYYKAMGNYKAALSMIDKSNKLTIRKFNAEQASKSQQLEARVDFETFMKQYDENQKKQEAEFEQKTQRRKTINIILVIVTIAAGLTLLVMAINGLVLKRINSKLQEAKDEISGKNIQLKHTQETIIQQRAEIEAQLETIKMQTETSRLFKMRMGKAIGLARSIQDALMTSRAVVHKYIGEHFIYWNSVAPVSGDFYWIRESGQYTYLIAADATGHGVPGAFLCMLGISIMNDLGSEIDLSNGDTMPGTFLNIMKQRFAKMMGIGKNQMSDSIDLALIKIDRKNRKIVYSGANRPLLIVSQNEYKEYKPTKMCIGYNILDRGEFANTEIEYQPGDMIYMFSDGFSDQFGGDDGHTKFGSRRLYELMASMSYLPMQIQESILRAVFQTWTQNSISNTQVNQIDDQLIIGVRMV